MWPRESATSAPPITAASSEATPGLTLRSAKHPPVSAGQRLRAAYPRPGPPASPSAPASRVGLGALRWNQSLARDALTEELLDAAANTLLIDWKEQAPVD